MGACFSCLCRGRSREGVPEAEPLGETEADLMLRTEPEEAPAVDAMETAAAFGLEPCTEALPTLDAVGAMGLEVETGPTAAALGLASTDEVVEAVISESVVSGKDATWSGGAEALGAGLGESVASGSVSGFDIAVACVSAVSSTPKILRLSTVPRVGKEDANHIFQPFRVELSDGSQPDHAKFTLVCPSPIELGRKVQLLHWTDRDYDAGKVPQVEDQEVFVSLSDRRKISVSVKHFSTFVFKLDENIVKLEKGDVKQGNRRFSRSYEDLKENEMEFSRGGMPYFLPAKFTRVAVEVPDWSSWRNEPVGFHGCSLRSAVRNLRDGFKIPSERSGGVKSGHIRLGREVFGVPNWADAIFLSPSHKYAMAPHYGGQDGKPLKWLVENKDEIFIDASSTCKGPDGEDLCLFVVLQCKMRKDQLTVNPKTGAKVFPDTSRMKECDKRVDGESLEYRVKRGDAVKPYGVLMRTIPVNKVEEFLKDKDWL